MKMINIPSYFKWLLFSALLVSFPFYVLAESEASAFWQLLEQLTQQSANTQAQAKSQSQQKWHILDEIRNSRSSSNPFNALLGGLVGVNCEKKDAEIQKNLLVPLKMIAHFLPRKDIESSGETAEEMANQIFPTFSPNKTTFPQQALIIEAIKDAIPIYKGMIASVVKRCGINHIRVARGLNFLAELYRSTNDYENAEYALLDALQIMTQPKYANDPDTGAIYNHLGIVYGLIGNHSKAKKFLKKAVALGEDVLGLNHPDTVSGLVNLASVYTVLGEYDKAEESFEKALTAILDLKPRKLSEAKRLENEIRGRFEGAEEVVVRQNAAHFYAMLGDYDKAETLLEESLELINNVQKRPHFFKAGIYHGLAYVYQQKADYERAIEHYEKALSIYQQLPAWKHSSLSVSTLSQFGYLYYLQGQKIQKAEQYLQQAVDLSSKVPGSVYTRELVLGSSFLYLGWFYQGIQQFDKAEEVLQKARQFYENNLGKEHSAVIESLQHLAALKFDQGKIEEAVRLTKQVQSSSEKLRKKILSFATEQQRLAYQKLSHPYDLLARMANKTGDSIPLANAILHNKGIVLDSLIEDFQLRATPETKAEIQQLKRQWTNLTMSFPEEKSAQRKRLLKQDKIERQLKKLISDLSPKIGQAHKAFDIQYQDVQKVLPKDTVLVEFIRYNHFIGRGEGEAYYGAVLIPKQGKPKWVFLGEAGAIEDKIVAYQEMMRCGKKCQQYDEKTVIEILETLYQRIWMPIEKQFPERTQSVILSPDGELNFVSFATLLIPKSELEFLVQKFDLYYVASGRDLLRKTKSLNDKRMLIYALDDWGTHPAKGGKQVASSIQNPVVRQADLYFLPLKHLKGIEPEVNALEKMAKTQQWTVETFFNSEATEKRLYDLDHSPHILHFATHGVFLHPKQSRFKTDFFPTSSLNFREIPLKFLSNPMRRSFITLAGAQMTLDAWNKEKNSPFPAENDGILTAEEVSLINLENTWLTMFSACETGRGEGRAGEGVLGLRRGFVQAGTENLLMTLWPFPDNLSEVREFEVEFYQEAIKTQNVPKALNDIQRERFLKLWDTGYPITDAEIVLDIVRLFGPFVVSFQGKL